MARVRSLAAVYFAKSGRTNTSCGHRRRAMKPGMALRTPNLRAA
jgi:hypothetical protein